MSLINFFSNRKAECIEPKQEPTEETIETSSYSELLLRALNAEADAKANWKLYLAEKVEVRNLYDSLYKCRPTIARQKETLAEVEKKVQDYDRMKYHCEQLEAAILELSAQRDNEMEIYDYEEHY